MTLEILRKKKIAILGYGVNNRDLVRFLIGHDIPVTILEKRAELKQDLGKYVTWEIRDNILKDLGTFDMVFRSPAIPFLSPYLQKAAKKGVEIYSQTKLFFDLCPAEIIGITGTKGKGTTATLTHAILKAGYKEGEVYLAGNIGVDPFSFYGKLTADDVVILELSSFQLQDLHKSPHIAVVLNVGIDHQDHHQSIPEYREAKKNILFHQTEEDSAIVNLFDENMIEYAHVSKGMTYSYSRFTPRRQSAWADKEGKKETIFVQIGSEVHSLDITGRKLLGEHNLDNILPAAIIGSLYGISPETMQKEIVAFAGLEHRLHLVGTFEGVSFYDDSIATNEDAASAAVQAFAGRRVHLIVGGDDKGDSYEELAETVAQQCVTVSLLPGTATKKISTRIIQALRKYPKNKCLVLDGAREPLMPTILSGIQPHLKKDDVVLLSPAGSSFSAFKNAKERGDLFVKAVSDRYSNSQS